MRCLYCKKEFKRKNSQVTCGIKCKLMSHIKIVDECWLWNGHILKNGYAKTLHNGKSCSVHRLSYEIHKGEIPKGLIVCHNCPGVDKKHCINPNHLWIGTYKDNMIDASNKGRMLGMQKWTPEMHEKMKERKKTWSRPDNRGEKSARSKLKECQVYEIRELLRSGMTHREIGEKYNVSKHTIGNINLNRRWAHI